MSARPIQMYSGVHSVRAAEAYRLALQERRDQWPYVHIFPPPNSQDVIAIGAVATQAQAAAAVAVVTYQVNAGKRFYLTAVLLSVQLDIGATYVPGFGLWTVDRNSLVGIADTQFMPEHGLVNIPVPLGTNTIAPFPLQRAREFGPLDIVRIKATNVGLSAGSPTFWIGGLFGYEVPTLNVKGNK